MNNALTDRFNHLLNALENERSFEIEAYRSLTVEKPIKERTAEGVTIYPLDFQDQRYSAYEELILDFKYHPDQHGKMFGTNGKCVLFSMNANESVDATMLRLGESLLSVILHADEAPEWIKEGKIGLNASCDTRTYDVQIGALRELLETGHSLAADFYLKPFRSYETPDFSDIPDLNASQNQAVKSVLSGSQFQIIHGPPGTGKTKTLVEAIRKLVEMGKRVLVATPTNAAADHISQELWLKGVPLLRYGHSLKIHERVMALTLHNRLKNHPETAIIERLAREAENVRKKASRFVRNFDEQAREERKQLREELKNIRRDIRSLERNIRHSILESSPVVTGTLIGLQQAEITERAVDVVIVDEAGQALEPAIWFLARYCPQLVLAGDPYQLPPTLFSLNAQKSELAKSLIEVAIDLNHPTLLLNTQYRMNDLILQYSNKQFYHSLVLSDNSVSGQKLENDPYLPVEFIDTAGCSFDEITDDSGGIYNPGEADILNKRIHELAAEGKNIGVISPYRKQVTLLRELPDLSNCAIETIDSFQGQEKDIILISLVRSNSRSEIGFLKDYRRMNVAMTRARFKLIIIGDSATVAGDSFYLELLDFIEKNGSYRSAYEYFS